VTLFAIFQPKAESADLPRVVAERFSFFACLLPPVFLLRHRLWLETLAWLIGAIALAVLTPVLGEAGFYLYLVSAVWLGFAAPSLLRAALTRRGWLADGYAVAAKPDLAQLEALK
jgi:hypothetical protein